MAEAEHVMIEGVPVQFLPSYNKLADVAIEHAATVSYEDVPIRVVRPEYLVAHFSEPSARTRKRRERAAALIESSGFDQKLLAELIERFGLEP